MTPTRAALRSVLHRVFREIAQSVPLRVDGELVTGRAAEEAWKKAFAQTFIADRSTESLSDEELKAYTLRIEAHAAGFMGCMFDNSNEERTCA